MKIRAAMPELAGVENWFNSKPLAREELLGGWTLIYFWSMSCGSCQQQFERLKQMLARYEQLQWISVHMPRTEEDRDKRNVQRYIKMQQHEEPVALDEAYVLTNRFGTHFVPSYYVFDQLGMLRYYQSGDRSLKLLEQRLGRFLAQ
ncbi:MAG: TlpA disulfide reductase family protein [Solibacillus sp.]